MPNYRRAFIPGGCWFFTVNLQDRSGNLLVERIEALREAVAKTRVRYPFVMNAFVILPDHIHAVWTLPTHESDFSTRWRLIKTYFSRSLPRHEQVDEIREGKGERGIWQRRFWEHMIRDETDYERHIDYCYINPVKHGLVLRVQDWPYSSFHRDVRAGIFPIDWAGDSNVNGEFGEVR